MVPFESLTRRILALGRAPQVALGEATNGRPTRLPWFRWTRRRGTKRAPLSCAQKRIWALQQIDPSSPLFNRPLALRLSGELQRPALQRVVSEIVRRHESLRTVFRDRRGEPRQVVLAPAPVALDLLDLRLLPRDARQAEFRRIVSIESRRPFDLTEGPLLRAIHLQIDQQEHLLLVVTHQIVFDAWSESVFLRELQPLYSAFARRRRSRLRELPFQYSDFVAWQQRRLQRDDISRQVAYWRAELNGMPSSLKLPADYPRDGSASSAAGVCSLLLPAGQTKDLKEFSRRERVNLFTTLLAAFQSLLACHAAQDDIVVGVPVPARTPPQAEALIGCFGNALVFRASLLGNPTVRELLAQVSETASRADANLDVPIEKIVEELGPERRANPWPLFQAMFQLHEPRLEPAAADWGVEPFSFDSGVTAGIDLNLEIQQVVEGLRCSLSYDAALFRPETAERMITHFRNVLEAMVRNPERPIRELAVLSEAAADAGRPRVDERRPAVEPNGIAVPQRTTPSALP